MDYTIQHKKNQNTDRTKSLILTVIISLLIFLGIFFYTFTKQIEKPEEFTTMLINFGDNEEGQTSEEPSNQQGSLAADNEIVQPEPVNEVAAIPEKILTGTNPVTSTPKAERVEPRKTPAKPVEKATPRRTAATKPTTPNAKTGTGDGKGTAAIGNLLKGRGTKPGTQGNAATSGNTGDPLGGEGNGDSKIGVDRRLVGFIPGTMGRGGAQPAHSCSASGTIHVAYTVDKAGNVVSARRSGGVSDGCIVSTSVSWVKQYVKAERSATSSTGTYSITF